MSKSGVRGRNIDLSSLFLNPNHSVIFRGQGHVRLQEQ